MLKTLKTASNIILFRIKKGQDGVFVLHSMIFWILFLNKKVKWNLKQDKVHKWKLAEIPGRRLGLLLEFIPFGFSDVPYAQLIPGCISADKPRSDVVR